MLATIVPLRGSLAGRVSLQSYIRLSGCPSHNGQKRCITSDSGVEEATAVVIGGGVVGTSIAYHLAKGGLKNVVLIDRAQLAASTWHKPGLISFYHPTTRFKQLSAYSIDLYSKLEAETGEKVLFHRPGTVRIATTPERVDELKYQLSRDWSNPRSSQLIGPDEVKKLIPIVDESQVLAGLYTTGDGYLDTGSLSMVLATGARKYGAKILERCTVQSTVQREDGYWDVVTDKGTIKTLHLVNAAGLWARDIGRFVNADLPLVCVQHQYCITSQCLDSSLDLPVWHDHNGSYYCRQDGSSILFGAFEKNPRLLTDWYTKGIPNDLSKDPLSADFNQIKDNYTAAQTLMPALKDVQIEKSYSRVLCMAPDGLPLLGPLEGSINYWVAGGFSDGVAVGGGVGMYLAQWVITGEPPFEITSLEPNRFSPWGFKRRNYFFEKSAETYAMTYANTFRKPVRPAGRPTDRISGIYGAVKEVGAQMNFRCGWEQCDYFKVDGVKTYREAVTREVGLVMNKVAIIDLSLYGKMEVRGPDATDFINYVFCCRPPENEKIIVGFMLTPFGKILSRMRITHHNKRSVDYMLLTRPEQEQRDFKWLELRAREKNFNVELSNVTEYLACIGLMGPLSAEVLKQLTKEDMSDEKFPLGTSRLIRLGNVPVIACHETTTGERGFQLYHNRADSLKVYEALKKAGKPHGIGDFGRWAFNTLRIEKGVKFWGPELNLDCTPFEAGVSEQIDFTKEEFVGLAAMKEMRGQPVKKSLRMLQLDDVDIDGQPVPGDPEGMESIWQGDKIIGQTTSGCYSPHLRSPLAFGYINVADRNPSEPLTVEIIGKKIRAVELEKPPMLPYYLRH